MVNFSNHKLPIANYICVLCPAYALVHTYLRLTPRTSAT